MSKEWGHGYHSGVEAVHNRKITSIDFMHVWHWGFKHCWWINIKRPVNIEVLWPYFIYITVLGFTWILCGGPMPENEEITPEQTEVEDTK